MSVRQSLYVGPPTSAILFKKGLKCSYELPEKENVIFLQVWKLHDMYRLSLFCGQYFDWDSASINWDSLKCQYIFFSSFYQRRKELESSFALLTEFDRGTDLSSKTLNIETAYLSLIVPYKILWQKLGTIWSAGTAVVETLGSRRLEDGLDIISIIHDFVDFGDPAMFSRRPFASLRVVKIR